MRGVQNSLLGLDWSKDSNWDLQRDENNAFRTKWVKIWTYSINCKVGKFVFHARIKNIVFVKLFMKENKRNENNSLFSFCDTFFC